MPEDKIKSCIFCEHCVCSSSITYSEVTYEQGGFTCYSNVDQISLTDEELDKLAGWTLKANTCTNYQLSDAIKKELNIK